MIKSKEDYLFYLEADRISQRIPKKQSLSRQVKSFISPNYIWEFQKSLRKLEYSRNCKKGLIAAIHRIFIKRKYRKLSMKLGFSIPINVFGPGLSIAHYGTIVVNSGAKIGANCRLHTSVNIGTGNGYADNAPTLGDNCYIAPGAKLYGGISIADNVVIGANAVVNKSFEENNIAIAGMPARKIADITTSDFIFTSSILVERGLNNDDSLLKLTARALSKKLNTGTNNSDTKPLEEALLN